MVVLLSWPILIKGQQPPMPHPDAVYRLSLPVLMPLGPSELLKVQAQFSPLGEVKFKQNNCTTALLFLRLITDKILYAKLITCDPGWVLRGYSE